jgi:hypothetical protein
MDNKSDMVKSLRQKTPFAAHHLQRFLVKTAVNGFTAVVN